VEGVAPRGRVCIYSSFSARDGKTLGGLKDEVDSIVGEFKLNDNKVAVMEVEQLALMYASQSTLLHERRIGGPKGLALDGSGDNSTKATGFNIPVANYSLTSMPSRPPSAHGVKRENPMKKLIFPVFGLVAAGALLTGGAMIIQVFGDMSFGTPGAEIENVSPGESFLEGGEVLDPAQEEAVADDSVEVVDPAPEAPPAEGAQTEPATEAVGEPPAEEASLEQLFQDLEGLQLAADPGNATKTVEGNILPQLIKRISTVGKNYRFSGEPSDAQKASLGRIKDFVKKRNESREKMGETIDSGVCSKFLPAQVFFAVGLFGKSEATNGSAK
jgi:hypothetical protein